MYIFVINGQGGSGKTTFEEYVSQAGSAYKVGATSMVAYVKQVAEKFGWTGTKELKDRKMLSQLKDMLSEWDDSPFLTTCMVVNQMKQDNVDICFIDAREPKDIDRLKERFNCKSVLIRREEPKTYGNHADDEVYNYKYDIIVENYGTLEDLKDSAEMFITHCCK